MRTLWIVPLALLFVPGVVAQDDGCTQSGPCTHFVDIDADGLDAEPLNATVGDWYSISFLNLDDRSHEVRLSGYGLSWTIEGDAGVLETDAFQLDETGDFVLTDQPTGDQIMVRVLSNDVVDVETGEDDPDTSDPKVGGEDGGADDPGAPGLPALILAGSLVGLAAWRRR